MSAFALDLGLDHLYNVCMKISMSCVKIVCVIGFTALTSGCAAYTVTNAPHGWQLARALQIEQQAEQLVRTVTVYVQ